MGIVSRLQTTSIADYQRVSRQFHNTLVAIWNINETTLDNEPEFRLPTVKFDLQGK
jgi:hypothetical protein